MADDNTTSTPEISEADWALLSTTPRVIIPHTEELTPNTIIGRGACEDTVTNILRTAPVETWVKLKNGCPFNRGYFHKHGGIQYRVSKDRHSLTLICWGDEHKHDAKTQHTCGGLDPKPYHIWGFNDGTIVREFPPFQRGDETEVYQRTLQLLLCNGDLQHDRVNFLQQDRDPKSAYYGTYQIRTDDQIRQVIGNFRKAFIEHKHKDAESTWEPMDMGSHKINGVFQQLSTEIKARCTNNTDPSRKNFWLDRPRTLAYPGGCYVLDEGTKHLTQKTVSVIGWSKYQEYRIRATAQVQYKPKSGEPAEFLKFLRAVWAGDTDCEQKILFLQEWLGNVLAGTTCSPGSQVHVLLSGHADGANGKGTLQEVISKMLPPGAISASSLNSVSKEFGIAPLLHSSLNIVDEAETGVVETPRLKSLMSYGPVPCNRKNKDEELVRLNVGWLVSCNQNFKPTDTTLSFYRRWCVLGCNNKFKVGGDPTLDARLEKDLPHIVSWCVEGYRRFLEQGYTNVPSSETAKQQWQQDADSSMAWAATLLPAEGKDAMGPRAAQAAYEDWCKQERHKYPHGGKKIRETLTRVFGFKHYKDAGDRFLCKQQRDTELPDAPTEIVLDPYAFGDN